MLRYELHGEFHRRWDLWEAKPSDRQGIHLLLEVEVQVEVGCRESVVGDCCWERCRAWICNADGWLKGRRLSKRGGDDGYERNVLRDMRLHRPIMTRNQIKNCPFRCRKVLVLTSWDDVPGAEPYAGGQFEEADEELRCTGNGY